MFLARKVWHGAADPMDNNVEKRRHQYSVLFAAKILADYQFLERECQIVID